MGVEKDFYEKGLDCLKVKKGKYSDYYYILRVSKNENSHFTFGQLLKIDSQFFCMFMPEMNEGNFLLMRQDTKDNNTIDLEIVIPNSKPIKPPDIHHQTPNNNEFYYKKISYEN